MRRSGLALRVFAAIVLVALFSTISVVVVARVSVLGGLARLVASVPAPPPGGAHARTLLVTGAERSFIAGVNHGFLVAASLSVLLAALVAYVLAATLSRPLERLQATAENLSADDLSLRVVPEGPREVVALGESFNRMVDSIEQSEDLRRRMVADVAHELRNPLAAARAQAEGIVDGVLPADSRRLGLILADLTRLSQLVDDLQDLAVADAGGLAYEFDRFDLAELSRRVVDGIAPSASPGVAVRWSANGVTTAWGDERRIGQALRNLMTNAVRHTTQGEIVLELCALPDETEIRVVDSGEGISAEDLPFVFERFYKADASRAASKGGTGLGLAITKQIVSDHGGTVFAESEPGVRTVIGFRLPNRPETV